MLSSLETLLVTASLIRGLSLPLPCLPPGSSKMVTCHLDGSDPAEYWLLEAKASLSALDLDFTPAFLNLNWWFFVPGFFVIYLIRSDRRYDMKFACQVIAASTGRTGQFELAPSLVRARRGILLLPCLEFWQ